MKLTQGPVPVVWLRPAGSPISDDWGPCYPTATPGTLATQFLTLPPPLPLTIPDQLLLPNSLCSHCVLFCPLWLPWLQPLRLVISRLHGPTSCLHHSRFLVADPI